MFLSFSFFSSSSVSSDFFFYLSRMLLSVRYLDIFLCYILYVCMYVYMCVRARARGRVCVFLHTYVPHFMEPEVLLLSAQSLFTCRSLS